MKHLIRRALVFLLFLAFGAAAAGAQTVTPPHLQGSLIIAGSHGMSRFVRVIADRFEQLHPQVKIEVQAVGSVPGMQLLQEGKAQVALITRNLTGSERHLQSVALGRDGAAIVVNEANPVHSLTTDQLRGIFLGRITNWAELGGRREPILLVGPPRNFPVEQQIGKYLGLDLSKLEFFRISSNTAERVRKVAGATNAIHIMGLGTATLEAAKKSGIKVISLDGTAPSPTAVRNNNYPMTRPLTLVTAGDRDRLTAEFAKYAVSAAVQDVITAAGFVTYLE